MPHNKEIAATELRIVIIDDYPVVRQGLCRILVDAGYCATCLELLDPFSSQQYIHSHEWDLAILGAPLNSQNWLCLLKDLVRCRPLAHVMVISDLQDQKHEVAALRNGATGYLDKHSTPAEIIKAVNKINEGGNFVSENLIRTLVDQLNCRKHQRPEDLLSEREFQVLRGLVDGKSTKELAAEMHLSSKTVSTYRARLCAKLGVHSNAELVRYALKHKLV